MKHLLCIQSHGGARDIVFRHWPYYKVAGADILAFDSSDKPHDWPEPVQCACVGKDTYFLNDQQALIRRLVNCFDYCVSSPELKDYDTFCVIEADGVFIRPLPHHPGGLVATDMGAVDLRWGVKAKHYLHTPWWADRRTAEQIVECGIKEMMDGQFENGSPDVWLGYITDRCGIPVHPAHAFSINPRDLPTYQFLIKRMLDAVSSGVFYVHGFHRDEDFQRFEQGVKARGLWK